MKIATWNVNSIRARAERVSSWLYKNNIDVLALQETKATDEQFPWEMFERNGYEVVHHGLNQWNGVAIASRVGIDKVQRNFLAQPEYENVLEPRAIFANCGGVDVWSLYVPNGRSLDDTHMAYKLDWLRGLYVQVKRTLELNPESQIVLMGDWNIAPTDNDVWDMKYFENSTHVSEAEREIFNKFIDTGYVDVVKPFYPEKNIYTYWDYKGFKFSKNEGMRIDFILASPYLQGRVRGGVIDFDERGNKGASDHAPVVIEISE